MALSPFHSTFLDFSRSTRLSHLVGWREIYRFLCVTSHGKKDFLADDMCLECGVSVRWGGTRVH